MAITARLLLVPTVAIIAAALIISFLTSLSLPRISSVPIVRITLGTGTFVVNGTNSQTFQEVRLGIWAACYYNQGANETCITQTLSDPYSVTVALTNDTSILADDASILANGTSTARVLESNIRHGLVFEPIATAAIFILFVFSFFLREIMAAIAFWISLLAIILTLISLALDVTTVIAVRAGMNGIKNIPNQTIPGTGLWLTVVTVCLLILASFTQHRLNIIIDRRKLRHTTIIQEHRV